MTWGFHGRALGGGDKGVRGERHRSTTKEDNAFIGDWPSAEVGGAP